MCGIIGIFNSTKATELAMLGLFAEQHRGQESCGIAVSDGKYIKSHTGMGLVKDVFTPKIIKKMNGHIAIGHVRYPTRGSSEKKNSQPHIVETRFGPSYALSSNGDLINYWEIRDELEKEGVFFASDNDGELLLKYIVYQIEIKKETIVDAIKNLIRNIKGAYSTVLATKNELYLFRDAYAMRPMCYSELKNGSIAVASESVALDILNPKWKKEMKAAQILKISENDIQEFQIDPQEIRSTETEKHCIFEHIYFSRPDSEIFSENVYKVREKIGALLSKDDVEVDVVVPVPDSSNFIALGYAKKSGKPFELGLIRNHYVGRTFIKPEQTIRDESVTQKFNPLPHFFEGKKIALVDDSIVRGTTLRKIVKLVKNAGAKEVHLRIGSPAVKYSCFYGIDTPTQEELIANNMSEKEICEFTGADSLKFLSWEDLDKSVSRPQNYCKACFNGDYPIK